MKALELGFRLPPESFEIDPDSADPNLVCGRKWYQLSSMVVGADRVINLYSEKVRIFNA